MSKQPPDVLSDADKRDIRDCALRVAGAAERAVAIHRAYLRTHGVRHGDPYFDFMSEVDNPCPDLLLRSRYREELLKRTPQAADASPGNDPVGGVREP